MLPGVSRFTLAKVWMPEGFSVESKIQAWGQTHFLQTKTCSFGNPGEPKWCLRGQNWERAWKPIDFNGYGTPWFQCEGQSIQHMQNKARIRVCGDYSVTVNSQLKTHRQPIPLPEDLMRNLWGGYCFIKVDFAYGHNQIKLAPESQKRLALTCTSVPLFHQVCRTDVGYSSSIRLVFFCVA